MLTQTNDDEQIKIDFQLFTPEEYSEIHLFIESELHCFETRMHTDVWSSALRENTQGIVEITPIPDTYLRDMIYNRMVERFNSDKDVNKYKVTYYKSQGCHNINWHDDFKYQAGATIYLNTEWNRNFGGYFIYQMKDQDTMTALQPKQGVAVYQKGGVLHATTPMSLSAPSRKSLQVFINE